MRLLKERRERTNKPQSDVHTTTTHSVGYSPPVVDHRRVEAAREEDFNPESIYSEDMISQKAGEISASRPQLLFTEAMEKYYDGGGTSQKSQKRSTNKYDQVPSRIHNPTISYDMKTIESKGPRTNLTAEIMKK